MAKKKEKKHRKFGEVIGTLALMLVVYVVLNGILSMKNGISTVIVRKGTEEDVVESTGYIFREQTVITAPESGYLYCEVQEDSRIKAGQTVMSIYKSRVNSEANSSLKALDEKIARLSGSTRKSEVFVGDSARLEQNIGHEAAKVPVLGFKNDVSAISEIAENINDIIEKKRIISGEMEPSSNEDELNRLKTERAALEAKHNIDRSLVHAPKSGAFSARVDGMEEMLSVEALENITPTYIREIDKARKTAQIKTEVKKGDAIGKIVNNFKWSYVTVLTVQDAEYLSVGKKMEIRFSGMGEESIEGTVKKISHEENGKVALVLECNSYVDMIYSTSYIEAELVKKTYSGLKIPSESVRIKDDVKGVYVIRNDAAHFVPVDMIYTNKDFSIVEEKQSGNRLKLYDELIVNGRDIYDGKDVR